jgi:hypothetical protein
MPLLRCVLVDHWHFEDVDGSDQASLNWLAGRTIFV